MDVCGRTLGTGPELAKEHTHLHKTSEHWQEGGERSAEGQSACAEQAWLRLVAASSALIGFLPMIGRTRTPPDLSTLFCRSCMPSCSFKQDLVCVFKAI